MGSHTAFLVVVLGVFGLALGSFANVVIYRVPRGESVVHPPSRCPTCGTPLSAAENVPIVSWVALRGRCRHCHTTISPRYPLVEGAMALVFAVTAGVVGPSWQLVSLVPLGAAVVVVVGIDVDGLVTPTPVLIGLGLAVALNAIVALATGDDAAIVRAVVAGTVTAMVGAAGAGPTGESTRSRHVARGVVAGSLGWFAGWASAAAAVVVAAVFALTTVLAIGTGTGRRAHRVTDPASDPAFDPAADRASGQGTGLGAAPGTDRTLGSVGRRPVPLWVPVVLAYGAVLGAAAAR